MTRGRVEPTITALDRPISEPVRVKASEVIEPHPKGVMLLATLFVLDGVASIGAQLLFGSQLASAFELAGIPRNAVALQLLLFGALSLLSGIVLFMRMKLGWFAAHFLLTTRALTVIQPAIIAYSLGVPFSLMRGATISPYTKAAIPLVLIVIIMVYLFRRAVLNYFSLKATSPVRLFASAVVAGVVFAFVVTRWT